jgi:hypothetical protein
VASAWETVEWYQRRWTIKRFFRGRPWWVTISSKRFAQQRRGATVQVVLQPGQALRLNDLRQAAAERMLAEDLAQTKQRRIHRMTVVESLCIA